MRSALNYCSYQWGLDEGLDVDLDVGQRCSRYSGKTPQVSHVRNCRHRYSERKTLCVCAIYVLFVTLDYQTWQEKHTQPKTCKYVHSHGMFFFSHSHPYFVHYVRLCYRTFLFNYISRWLGNGRELGVGQGCLDQTHLQVCHVGIALIKYMYLH